MVVSVLNWVFIVSKKGLLYFSGSARKISSLQGKTVHWICAQFLSVCSGFQTQILNHVGILSERSKKMKEQKKNKKSILFAESSNNSQNAQFGLVMFNSSKMSTTFLKFIKNPPPL